MSVSYSHAEKLECVWSLFAHQQLVQIDRAFLMTLVIFEEPNPLLASTWTMKKVIIFQYATSKSHKSVSTTQTQFP